MEYGNGSGTNELERAGAALLRSVGAVVPVGIVAVAAWMIVTDILATPFDCACHPIKASSSKRRTSSSLVVPFEGIGEAPTAPAPLLIEPVSK